MKHCVGTHKAQEIFCPKCLVRLTIPNLGALSKDEQRFEIFGRCSVKCCIRLTGALLCFSLVNFGLFSYF